MPVERRVWVARGVCEFNGRLAVEPAMEVIMEVIMEVTSAQPEDSDETRTAPSPRITVPRITVPIIALAANRPTLHSISEGIHALGISDIVARLEIELAGGCIVGTDSSATYKARRRADRGT
jgi:hypothetical protein